MIVRVTKTGNVQQPVRVFNATKNTGTAKVTMSRNQTRDFVITADIGDEIKVQSGVNNYTAASFTYDGTDLVEVTIS